MRANAQRAFRATGALVRGSCGAVRANRALRDASAGIFGDVVGGSIAALADGAPYRQGAPAAASVRRAAAVFVDRATFEAPSSSGHRRLPTDSAGLRVLFAVVGFAACLAGLLPRIANSTVKTHLGRLFARRHEAAGGFTLVAAFSHRLVG